MAFDTSLAAADQAVLQHLGGPVTYAPGVGAAVSVTGVFDAVYQLAQAGEPGVGSSGPAVFLLLEDLPSDPATDEALVLTINGTAYRPAGAPEKDGKGGVVIRLHEAV